MFKGSVTALVTPFDHNDSIDEQALVALVKWHIRNGSNGLVPAGTTGEAPTLSHTEHQRVIELVVQSANGKIPVIAGAGSNNTREAIELTQHAEQAGADAVLHVAGYYNRPNQEGLFRHFEAVHNNSNIPIIIYNIPARAVVKISPDTMARLATLRRVVGVKDATGDLAQIAHERVRIKTGFCYLSGEDATALAYNASGGRGCISVTANVAPRHCAQLQQLCLREQYQAARQLQDLLMPLHEALFSEPSPAGAKYACSLLKLCRPDCRLPIVPLQGKTRIMIVNAMKRLGLIDE